MPEILCSTASAISIGFFIAVGNAVPTVSFNRQTATSSSAGTKNHGCANHGNFPRWAAGVFHHSTAPYALVPSKGVMATPVSTEI